MRHGDDALMFAADVEHALHNALGPRRYSYDKVAYIRQGNITLIFDFDAWLHWQQKSKLIRRMLAERHDQR